MMRISTRRTAYALAAISFSTTATRTSASIVGSSTAAFASSTLTFKSTAVVRTSVVEDSVRVVPLLVTSYFPENSPRNSYRMYSSSSSPLYSSNDGGVGENVDVESVMKQVRHIGKAEMKDTLMDMEDNGRESMNCVVIDVRNEDEIQMTGKLSDCVHTLPLPIIAQFGAFNMDSDDFEEAFGFEKPSPDETIVFTCKAGIRSMHAAQFAAMSGYTNIVNYSGGADEWFY